MGFKSFIESIFGKKRDITSLISGDFSFEMPELETYLEDKPMLELIERFKQEYLDKLKGMKYSDINTLNADILRDNIRCDVLAILC